GGRGRNREGRRARADPAQRGVPDQVAVVLDARFAAWIAVAIVLIVTPGPDTALIIRNALRGGARSASLSAIGIGAGSSIWAAASVLGVAFLLESSDLAFTVLKYAGAAYLIYLGL